MILVTGATGLVGSQLVRQLVQQGHRVRGLKRSNSPMELVADVAQHIEWVEGDVNDIFSLAEAMTGVTELYHAAAVISFLPAERERMMQVNVEGTANVVNTAIDAGVQRALLISSVAAFGRPQKRAIIDENLEIKDSKDNYHYYRSKLHAEREWWRGIAEGLNANILSPSTIFGGGFWKNQPNSIFAQVHNGYPFYTTGTNSFVDVRDVVQAAQTLMQSQVCGEKVICTAENAGFDEVMFSIADALGVKRPTLPVGKYLASVAWRAEALKSRLTGSYPLVTSESVRLARDHFEYSNSKALKMGISFRPLQQTIQDVARLYRETRAQGYGIL
ncbi:MAG: SDR family NAD(P)-dependent oxidoreductase [Chitinophagales bacterium]